MKKAVLIYLLFMIAPTVVFGCKSDVPTIFDDADVEDAIVDEPTADKPEDDVDETEFYKAAANYKVTKNLVDDYNVDNSFDTDDSEKLQQAIDEVSNQGGGKIYIPKGEYTFTEIQLKSDVGIQIEAETVIRPAQRDDSKGYVVFWVSSNDATPIENVSIVGVNGQFTIDISNMSNKNNRCVLFQNVSNFKLENMRVEDDYSKFAAIVCSGIEADNWVHGPRNGVIKNIDVIGADYGYGVMQMQLGKNIFFKDIYGLGGATLRFEPHVKNLRTPGTYDVIDNIVGRNITCENGNAALMLSPHYINNGTLDMSGIHGIGAGFAIRIEKGFTTPEEAGLGLTPGSFNSATTIRNVTASYTNSKAQLKPKHYKYMPCHLRDYISTEPITPGGASFHGPSIAAVVYVANYTVDIREEDVIISGGFSASEKIVTADDAMSDDGCNKSNQ